MPFKFNISHKGRTYKTESDNEGLIRMKIGEKLQGNMISADLEGYELEITGTSDIAGFPGIKGEIGPQLRRILLTRGMKGNRKPSSCVFCPPMTAIKAVAPPGG